jgi:hypothetical protein
MNLWCWRKAGKKIKKSKGPAASINKLHMATTQPKNTNEVIYQVELHVEKEFKQDVLDWLEKV